MTVPHGLAEQGSTVAGIVEEADGLPLVVVPLRESLVVEVEVEVEVEAPYCLGERRDRPASVLHADHRVGSIGHPAFLRVVCLAEVGHELAEVGHEVGEVEFGRCDCTQVSSRMPRVAAVLAPSARSTRQRWFLAGTYGRTFEVSRPTMYRGPETRWRDGREVKPQSALSAALLRLARVSAG
ncbi:hypothetical protein [Micromonospora sp. MH99]|uniref:hypothetical protein n=1 Tax=Micromonospora sp. MH99 TaxID=1945510 RepID=UPI001F18BBDB|nr:hypothetical protein [Micromonospora sp. MH99]